MSLFRLIARLDIKAPNLIKGVQMEGLRKVGDPHEYALKYATAGIDELLYMDCVASLYGRNQLLTLLEKVTDETFVPITVGGGIRNRDDAAMAFFSGADRVCINTGAHRDPSLIEAISGHYGSQACSVSIEAKRKGGGWECYTEGGRQKTGRDCREWASEAVHRGAGEILLTSVDMEGTRQGFDLDLIAAICPHLPVPVVVSGGCGSPDHVRQAIGAGADAVAVADCLHYGRYSIEELRQGAISAKRPTAKRSEHARIG